jgi:hypothetical protein
MPRRRPSTRSDVERIQLFLDLADQLEQTKFVREGGEVGLKFDWRKDQPAMFTLKEPDEETLRSFLMLLRKFLAEESDAYLFRIYSICDRRLRNEDIGQEVRRARAALNDRLEAKGGMALEYDGRPVTPKETIRLFFNGIYFHDDEEKRAELHSLWPAPIPRMQFLDIVVEAAKHALFLAHTIRIATARGDISLA